MGIWNGVPGLNKTKFAGGSALWAAGESCGRRRTSKACGAPLCWGKASVSIGCWSSALCPGTACDVGSGGGLSLDSWDSAPSNGTGSVNGGVRGAKLPSGCSCSGKKSDCFHFHFNMNIYFFNYSEQLHLGECFWGPLKFFKGYNYSLSFFVA